MAEQSEEPTPEFYVVQPESLIAGNYPNAWDEKELRAKLRDMLERGVTFFLDLTEKGEADPYLPLLKEEAEGLGVAVEYQQISIPDNGTPTVERMRGILSTIDAALAANHLVYVHCCFGVGRTGTVVGCYLVRRGFKGEEALNELVRLRKGTHFEGMSSPSTHKQREMIKNWSVGG